MSERKTKKHRQYTIDEKNEIVQMYLTGETKGIGSLAKDLDVYKSMIERWIKQYQEFGTKLIEEVNLQKIKFQIKADQRNESS